MERVFCFKDLPRDPLFYLDNVLLEKECLLLLLITINHSFTSICCYIFFANFQPRLFKRVTVEAMLTTVIFTSMTKDAVQIICDTLGGLTKCHMNFFAFLKSYFNVFGSKKSCSRVKKNSFTLIHFKVQV